MYSWNLLIAWPVSLFFNLAFSIFREIGGSFANLLTLSYVLLSPSSWLLSNIPSWIPAILFIKLCSCYFFCISTICLFCSKIFLKYERRTMERVMIKERYLGYWLSKSFRKPPSSMYTIVSLWETSDDDLFFFKSLADPATNSIVLFTLSMI